MAVLPALSSVETSARLARRAVRDVARAVRPQLRARLGAVAERVAREELRTRPGVRALVLELTRVAKGSSASAVQGLAARIEAVA
jgi:hypothetical protein